MDRIALEQTKDPTVGHFYPFSSFSGLHCPSLFRTVQMVAGLIKMECYNVNGGGVLGYLPLGWAARNRCEELVKMLLGWEGVDPDWPDIDD